MTKNYRLIWFQHLHRVAGASISRLAIANRELLYPKHSNGNPLNADGKLIRLWEMDAAELSSFVDHCEQEDITFVATEWRAPDFTILASDSRVILITCIRDPLDRFLSEFYYSLYRGHGDTRSFEAFVNSKQTFSTFTNSMFNYYCRIFSRYNDNPEPIDQEQFELAKSALSLFHCCAVLKENDPFADISKVLGWTENVIHVNHNAMDFILLLKLIAKGKIHQLWRRLIQPRKEPNEDFLRFFKEMNQWDYKLYREAKINVSYQP